MTIQKKKSTRRKAYKYMSVSELVTARKELVAKMEQIDTILKEAVQAYSAGVSSSMYNNNANLYSNNTTNNSTSSKVISNSNYDSAFGNPSIYQDTDKNFSKTTGVVSNNVPNNNVVNQRANVNAPNQTSSFTIFDAEALARQEQNNYLAQEPAQQTIPDPSVYLPQEPVQTSTNQNTEDNQEVSSEFSSNDIDNEINSIKQELQNRIEVD